MSFGPHTVTIVPREWDGNARDRQNNPVITEGTPFAIAGCFVQQQSAAEDEDARETDVSRWVAICPPGSGSVGHIDHVRVPAASVHVDPDPGQTYATFRQIGEPDALDHVDGTFHHLELILERVQL